MGHVHINVRASFGNAFNYEGVNFIILPAIGPEPRPYGIDFTANPKGYAIMDIEGTSVKELTYRTLDGEEFVYQPTQFQTFVKEDNPTWFTNERELPGNSSLIKGDFENGFDSWLTPYKYQEDTNPARIREIRNDIVASGSKSAYLYTRGRTGIWANYDPLTLIQVVNATPSTDPILKLSYYIDDYLAGGYTGLAV